MSEWQTIDSAPKDGTLILVWDEPSPYIETVTRRGFWRIAKWVWGKGFGCEDGRRATAWAHLPSAPLSTPASEGVNAH